MDKYRELNERVIAEFRADKGHSGTFGADLMHSIGAKTGTERIRPAMSLAEHGAWFVVAAARGAQKDPQWMVNLRAHPEIEIEVASGDGVATVPVTAIELQGSERDAVYDKFAAQSPGFEDYKRTVTERVIPVVRLHPRT